MDARRRFNNNEYTRKSKQSYEKTGIGGPGEKMAALRAAELLPRDGWGGGYVLETRYARGVCKACRADSSVRYSNMMGLSFRASRPRCS